MKKWNELKKLMHIKRRMEELDRMIEPFIFSYNKSKYIVLISRFREDEPKKCVYSQVKLCFLRYDDFDNMLLCEADRFTLIIDAKELRIFFGIEYSPNLGDILKQFTNYFDFSIPDEIKSNISEKEKEAVMHKIKINDPNNANKIYCIGVKRNPIGWRRTDFNFDKARILVPKVFDYFKFDETISFCFSENKADEKSYEEIIRNFAKNKLN